jgi:hypothetical protein
MSFEIQLRTETLVRMTAGALRRVLRGACLPAAAGISVDRLDVVDGEVTLAQGGPAVVLRVPVDAYLVSDADLFAHPNDTPQGALQRAGRLVFAFAMAIEAVPGATSLRMTALKPEGEGVPGPLIDALWNALGPQMTAMAIPLTPLLDALRVTGLGAPDVVTGDGIVAGRFAAKGPAVSRLAPGQDWGVFLGAETVTAMIRNLIEPRLTGALDLLKVEATYREEGGLPVVRVEAGAKLGILGVELGASVALESVLRLLAGPPPALRIAAGWSVDVDLALLVPVFGIWAVAMEPIAEAAAREFIASALDPTEFGATPTGQTSFLRDEPLPPLAFGPATLRYDSLVASGAGMVLGGAVLLPVVANPPFRLRASRFGLPARTQICSKLAKSGSGAPSREPPTIHNTTVYAVAELEGAGRFCRIEMRSPGPQWRPRIATPADGEAVEDFAIEVRLIYREALSLGGPLSFVLRTPRGVRFVDFGQPPPPRADAQGRLLDVIDGYIRDCLHVVPRRRGRWGIGWHFEKEDFVPRPPEEPDWNAWLRESGGLIVQLVEIERLDPGEFLRFRSGSHVIEATADAAGRLSLPVLLPLRERAAPALLERADGRPLAGHLRMESASFEPMATLPGSPAGSLRATPSGGLQLDLRQGRELMRHRLGAFGLTSTRLAALNPQPLPPGEDGDAVSLNPQPLPPVADGAWSAERVRGLGIRDVEGVFAVPGFADRPLAVARLGEGDMLLLDLAGAKPRIAGVMRGPFGALDTTAGAAMAREAERVTLFRRATLPEAGAAG